MSRTRLILAGLLAVLAVSVVASASGTEPPKKCGGKRNPTPTSCVEGLQLENSKGEPASESVEGTDGTSMLKATVAGVTSEVECKGGKTTGSIKDGASGTVGKSRTVNTLEECKMLTPTNCKLASSKIKTAELIGELKWTGTRIEDKLAPEIGFAIIGIEGKESSCVIAEVGRPKNFEVVGSQICEIDKTNAEAETEATTHKLVCKTSGGSLKIGENKAEMTSEATTTKLISGKKWSIKEST